MKYIKTWFSRFLVALFGGGLLSETMTIIFGETPLASFIVMFCLIFIVTTIMAFWNDYKYYFFPPKTKEEDVLDSDL